MKRIATPTAPQVLQEIAVCPCHLLGFNPPSDQGIRKFEALFVPLPEIYISEARDFMDAYQDGDYITCFGKVSIDTILQEPSGLLSIYLASAALATFDIPQAEMFLDLSAESGKFVVGYWWYRAMLHTLLQEEELAKEALGMVMVSPLPQENRLLSVWGEERKTVARKILTA